MTRDPEEARFVQEALHCVEANDAGHWPTVASYLAMEVHRLRAALEDASTPAFVVVLDPFTLDTYPVGTVIVDVNGDAWQRVAERGWSLFGQRGTLPASWVIRHAGPVQIVWTPPQEVMA